MKKIVALVTLILLVFGMTACKANETADLLNPDKPIVVTIWHYYNGSTKEAFDSLIREFNETIGMERGIVIDAQSQGDVTQLATSVFDAANESIGAAPMPDIFASYPDNAYRVHQIKPLVYLETYFSEEELAKYRQDFLDEGRFITDNHYYIVPIAKSSETLYVNKREWEKFADSHGYDDEKLSTWEGIYDVAKRYHEETGKGFFSIDANANFILVTAKQMGSELYTYSEDGTAVFNMPKEVAKRIWDYLYTPYINGYYVKTGRFSSDDAKTETVLAYTGSTAGAAYFPMTVTPSEYEEYETEPLVMPYPHYDDGEKISIQQGAGMCIAKSDSAHEYAASLFLKWFTGKEQNLKFAISTGYFPVENEALDETEMLKEVTANPAIIESIKASSVMFRDYSLYNSKPFAGSYEMRELLENNLFGKMTGDLSLLNDRVATGESRESVVKELTSEQSFEEWYGEINREMKLLSEQFGH